MSRPFPLPRNAHLEALVDAASDRQLIAIEDSFETITTRVGPLDVEDINAWETRLVAWRELESDVRRRRRYAAFWTLIWAGVAVVSYGSFPVWVAIPAWLVAVSADTTGDQLIGSAPLVG